MDAFGLGLEEQLQRRQEEIGLLTYQGERTVCKMGIYRMGVYTEFNFY